MRPLALLDRIQGPFFRALQKTGVLKHLPICQNPYYVTALTPCMGANDFDMAANWQQLSLLTRDIAYACKAASTWARYAELPIRAIQHASAWVLANREEALSGEDTLTKATDRTLENR